MAHQISETNAQYLMCRPTVVTLGVTVHPTQIIELVYCKVTITYVTLAVEESSHIPGSISNYQKLVLCSKLMFLKPCLEILKHLRKHFGIVDLLL